MTATKLQSVKFDPGYAKHTTILSISLDYIYKKINSIKNFNQKKIQFKMNYPQIVKMVDKKQNILMLIATNLLNCFCCLELLFT